jgi:inosine-uridine nucleoside N-ribohydrolase
VCDVLDTRSSVFDLILDTDTGFDDMFAVSVLLGAPTPAVQLRGVTTVHGMSDSGLGATTMERLLAKLDVHAPVVAGANEPRPGGHLLEEVEWGREYIADYPALVDTLDLPPAETVEPGSASAAGAAILAAAALHPGATLFAIGPLTNVAAALEAQSEEGQLASLISRVVIMGGAVRGEGNMGDTYEAELNFYSDPEAAAIVLNAGLPISLLDLQATSGEMAFGAGGVRTFLDNLSPLEGASPAGQVLRGMFLLPVFLLSFPFFLPLFPRLFLPLSLP